MASNVELVKVKRSVRKTNRFIEGFRLLRIISISILFFFVFITFIIRPVYVSGDSMYPKLKDGEIAGTNILLRHLSSLERFDIVTVYNSLEDKKLVKRVIGLPNETIQYRDDRLYINGEYVAENFFDKNYVKEQTNNGHINFTNDFGPITLKKNEYFLMGDNRRISKDSRILGPFLGSEIISKDIFFILQW